MSKMAHRWFIPEEIKGYLRHFPPFLKQQVRQSLDEIVLDFRKGKMLEEDLSGLRSYRIGKYRLIYSVEKDRLVLVGVGPRRDIYERIALEIGRAKIRERAAKYGAKSRKLVQLVAIAA